MNAWIIGGGFAAACCCHELREQGFPAPHVFEREPEWGGLVRSRRISNVIYEPHGSHIFHTDDEEVWNLATSLVPFNSYEHTVTTVIKDRKMTWPIQADEVREAYGGRVAAALRAQSDLATGNWVRRDGTPALPDPAKLNFEEWCLGIMPREVYEDFVKPYTEKQWGRPAKELSADFAPKRVQVRNDGDKRLFKDRFQGYPDGRLEFGWEDLLRELFGSSLEKIKTNNHVTLKEVLELLRRHPAAWRPDVIVLTVPMDDFCAFELGHLSWRGLRFERRWVDTEETGHVLPGMVVNYPGKEFAWIRQHEAKYASGQVVRGTVVVTEFPSGEGRYYPVPGKDAADRKRNEKYIELATAQIEELGPKVLITGRLATFRYLDTDEVMREALDGVRAIALRGETITTGGLSGG